MFLILFIFSFLIKWSRSSLRLSATNRYYPLSDHQFGMSTVYKRYKIGLRTPHCGTPACISCNVDLISSCATRNYFSDKYVSRSRHKFPGMRLLILKMRPSCHTLLYAWATTGDKIQGRRQMRNLVR